MKKAFILLLLVLLLQAAYAQEFPDHKNIYLNDFADIFTKEQASELGGLLTNIEKETTAEVVVVSLETTAPYSPQEYRTKLFNYWKIGKKDKNNGLLILYSVKEKRIEVEVGYGLEGILPDSKVGRLLDEHYVPLRDKRNVQEGIIKFTKETVNVLRQNKEEVITSAPSARFNWFIILLFFIILALVIFLSYERVGKTQDNKLLITPKGVKGDLLFKISSIIFSIIIALPFFFTNYRFMGIALIVIINFVAIFTRGTRCAIDNAKMKFLKRENYKSYYTCPNGHVGIVPYNPYPYRGGHFGGGFGGSFGGGASGGGGAGR